VRVRVETPARLHFGFLDLSGGTGRLYGGVGVAVDRPRAVVEAESASVAEVERADRAGGVGDDAEQFERLVRGAVDALGVPGARLRVRSALPRHVGLGSGTQHASAVLEAVARANGVSADRRHVREMGRGVRSGVGRGAFEGGGFIVDAGHPADTERADRSVPSVAARHALPSDWRFVVAVPDGEGAHGDEEERRMRRVVGDENGIGDAVRREFTGRVLPGAADGDIDVFGAGVAELDRLNGVWYADEQDGVYHEASAPLVEDLGAHEAVAGAGQSSWGPSVYAVTTAEDAEDVADSVGARTYVASPDNEGARISLLP
jgi:beta-ribofuranosylaminobenzene 5'-phosphate synthase